MTTELLVLIYGTMRAKPTHARCDTGVERAAVGAMSSFERAQKHLFLPAPPLAQRRGQAAFQLAGRLTRPGQTRGQPFGSQRHLACAQVRLHAHLPAPDPCNAFHHFSAPPKLSSHRPPHEYARFRRLQHGAGLVEGFARADADVYLPAGASVSAVAIQSINATGAAISPLWSQRS
ncbi:hypothetical protein BU26DRAFT_216711 [Trematosphaeria pertusa]|uniref:Uncharacterized protein n=1 Tax=Trematosphaeria pertusa TaxID=390896 RepID=A0A6A6IRJ9_9PLEO|nr:uncharacterized protein BU26DRAFT_216711 [Trematosphaeria pertusa]KAF2253164.1 hypothetical protein BU26DRAFT_216711 [Trematosphaeria pertusa]